MEIIDYYLEQIENIRKSAALYDSGDLREAIRISLALRILFHRGKDESLLAQVIDPKAVSALSTVTRFPSFMDPRKGIVPFEALVMVGTQSGYAAPLSASPCSTMLPFLSWWDEEPIYYFNGTTVTRHELVKDAANKDGGAHVDRLTARYRTIRDGHWRTVGTDEALTGSELASLRQIAHEVLNSPRLTTPAS